MKENVWTAPDGVRLFYRSIGEGRPVILVHGLFSDSITNWVKFGAADRVAAAGFQAILPDLRAHGQSDKPRAPAAYSPGILARDLAGLVAHLRLGDGDYDLGGFSLGARTAVQAIGEGLKPRRAILAGMGLEGLSGWLRRKDFFLDAIARFDEVRRGDPAFMAVSFMKTMRIDRDAARLLLETFEDARPEWLAAFTMPTLVLCGSEDHDNGSAEKLAAALPAGTYQSVPGTHMSSVTSPEFGHAIAAFVEAPPAGS